MNKKEAIIDIVRYNTQEYVFECLAKFNEGIERVTLRAFGGNMAKGVEIARILHREAGIETLKSKLDSIVINKFEIPYIEIPLRFRPSKLEKKDSGDRTNIKEDFKKYDFINYSTYHLLFDWYLKDKGYIKISARDRNDKAVLLLEIKEKDGKRSFKTGKTDNLERRVGFIGSKVNNALSRSGLLLPDKWCEIGEKLSKYDDIILGIDTNILFFTTVTRHLLPILSLVEPKEFVHTPNWLLLIVPSTVMYEIEEAANIRDDYGKLTYKGRKGFRALQEVIELSENINIPGVSLMIHGETNPTLDIKNSLFGLRKNLHEYYYNLKGDKQHYKPFKKSSSSGDMAIRHQFKKFLNQVDFHKGTFFLTADKTCSVLAQAEGLSPVYVSYAHLNSRQFDFFTPTHIPDKLENGTNRLTLNVPLGNIIYELAVSFGEIIVSCGDYSPSIECDCKGSDISHWVHKQLKITGEDLEELLRKYKGKYNLAKVENMNKEITKRFENVEWLSEMGGAFESKE